VLQCGTCVAVCCSVLQCVAVCCSLLQSGECVAVCCSVLQCVAHIFHVLFACKQRSGLGVLQYVAVCCNMLQGVSIGCHVTTDVSCRCVS